MFTSDRDLLVLEPNVFRDAGWVGQRLLNTTGSVSGTTMTLVSGSFTAAGIAPGHVLVYDAVAIEVISVTSATVATVSLLRAKLSDAPIPPPALGVKPVACWTFRPQISLVHAQVLRMLGIDPDAPSEAMVTEASIVNPLSLALAESLGALHIVYSAAAALSQADSALAARAQMYRQRFGDERQRAVARIDLDGDGEPDATRRLNVIQFLRA
jgi:hypothetical protein